MAFMGMIFFLFGFVTTFNVTLADKFKAVFELSNFEAQLVNGAFFFTYFLLSFSCGSIIKKIGYKSGIILGLGLVAVGSFLFFPAAKVTSFPFFLFAIFVMASGVVFLQVAANPYVAALGPDETASGRLNFTQALNSIATYMAPIIASVFIFKVSAGSALTPQEAAKSVPTPFLIISVIVILIALAVYLLRLPEISTHGIEKKSIWKYPHVILGSIGIFCYVGAEVGTAAMLQRYFQEALHLAQSDAAMIMALYWGGAMVGRFYGSFMLSNVGRLKQYLYAALVMVLALFVGWFVRREITDGLIFTGIAALNYIAILLGRGKTARSLAIFSMAAALLLLIVISAGGNMILWLGLSVGFFNSIMFPNIFSLGVKGLDKGELSMASGLINSLIVGGAVIPVLMGKIADGFGVKYAFILPIVCYMYILFYALVGSRQK
jgi:FHS family L-fucose permease-like MFS transporter